MAGAPASGLGPVAEVAPVELWGFPVRTTADEQVPAARA